jgi:multidrug efflux pump subunit AcrA (membrane-fusion protein)
MTGTFAVTKLYDQHVHPTGPTIDQGLLYPLFDMETLEEQQPLADSIIAEENLAMLSLPAPNLLVPDIWGHPDTLCFTPSQPWNQAKRLCIAESYVQTNPFIGLFALLTSVLVLGFTSWFIYVCCCSRKSYSVDEVCKNEGILSNLTYNSIPPHSRSSTTSRSTPPSTLAALLSQSREPTAIPDERPREQNLSLPDIISPSPLEDAVELRKKIQKLENEERDVQALTRETWDKYENVKAERNVALRARDEAIHARESAYRGNDDLRREVKSLRAQLDLASEWTDTHEDITSSDLEKTQADLRQAQDENEQLRTELEHTKATQSTAGDLTQELKITSVRMEEIERELKHMTTRAVEADNKSNNAKRTIEELKSKLTESRAQLDEECTKTTRLELDLTIAHDEVAALKLQTRDGRVAVSGCQPNQEKDIQKSRVMDEGPTTRDQNDPPHTIEPAKLGTEQDINPRPATINNMPVFSPEPTSLARLHGMGQSRHAPRSLPLPLTEPWTCHTCNLTIPGHISKETKHIHWRKCKRWSQFHARTRTEAELENPPDCKDSLTQFVARNWLAWRDNKISQDTLQHTASNSMPAQLTTPVETSVVPLPSPTSGTAATLSAEAPTFTPGNAKLEQPESTESQTYTVNQPRKVEGAIWCDICGNGFVDDANFQFTKNHLPACRKWKADYEGAFYIRRTDKGKVDVKFPPQYWNSHTRRQKKDPSWLVTAKAKFGELSQEKPQTGHG